MEMVKLGISLMELENEVSTQETWIHFRTNFEIIIETKIGKYLDNHQKSTTNQFFGISKF